MKRSVDELAICGGQPTFAEPLHVGRPNIGNEEHFQDRVKDIFARRWFTNGGPYVEEFERRVAEISEVKHCVATCNATVALEFAVRALDMKGEVILPSFTFIATAHALEWQGITPVFCDIDRKSHSIDPNKVEELVTPLTTGVIGVHVWGRGCDTAALGRICQERGISLVYDAAHAFGCSHRGRMIGSFGDAEVFSFHATKSINSFEGGAVLTNNDKLAERVRLMRNFGFSDVDNVTDVGLNGKMSEISAAMGLTSIESRGHIFETNERNYKEYRRLLSCVRGLEVIRYDPLERSSYQYVVVEVDERGAGVSRDLLIKALQAEGIMARRYFYPGCHRMEPYRTLQPRVHTSLPETERLANRVLQLPTGTAVNPEVAAAVSGIIAFIIHHAEDLRSKLNFA